MQLKKEGIAKGKNKIKLGKLDLKFDFHKMLLMFALIPLIVSVVIITTFLINKAKQEIKVAMHNYMYSMALSEGASLESEIKNRGVLFSLAEHNLAKTCEGVGIIDVPSSYCYVADKDGIMLYHPTAEKVGQPVSNATILNVCENMKAGVHLDPDVVEYKFNGEKKYAAYYVAENFDFVLVISADEKDVMAEMNKMTILGLGMAIILVIVFVVIATIYAKKFSDPLKKVVEAMSATAEGDLNADTNIKASIFETKNLVASAVTLQNVLKKTIGDTQSISADLKDGAENVAELAQKSREGSDQISQAMDDLAQGASSMAENVSTINVQIIEMGHAIDAISDNAEELVVLSNSIKDANSDAAEYIEKVSGSSEKSVDAVSAISEQINSTNSAVTKIKDAADMIGSIASQTNLLALNASIEAARAGEAGRGFSVVAEEIKNLSEQSNASADVIRQVVKEVIAQSEKSVSLASSVAEIIEEEQEYIEETEKKFEVLQEQITKSLSEIENISTKVSDLNEAKVSITSSVSDLSAISEENAASNEEVSASVSEIAASIGSIADNSVATNEMAVNLTDTVSYFK